MHGKNPRRSCGVLTAVLLLSVRLAEAQAPTADATDWPHEIDSSSAKITVYQPQPETLEGDKLSGRAVVAVEREGETDPAYGSVWLEVRVAADPTNRTVTLRNGRVTKVRFPHADSDRESKLSQILENEMSDWSTVMSLDALIATLELADVERQEAQNLSSQAPKILYRDHPAMLLPIEGRPQLRQEAGISIIQVINTPFFVVFDRQTEKYYLFDGRYWLEAEDPNGKWKVPQFPPTEVIQLTPNADAKRALETGAAPGYGVDPPEIIVATEPTELLVTTGPPKAVPIEGTQLLAVSNTGSDLFFDGASKQYFVLLAGRWFTSASLNGPWTGIAADQLPEDFAKIPSDSDYADILSSVAGTVQAAEAVLEAQVPKTASVKRDEAFAVSYDGPPRFDSIDGTDMQYAVNTSKSVVFASGKYYCADLGVWYVAGAPEGPWSVATEVAPEIYTIPTTSSVYHLTYVHIFDSDDEEVHVGYYPGYTGTYVYGDTVVYGTGWTYRPWVGTRFFARPVTWGYQFRYTPRVGWGVGFSYDPGYFHHSIGFGRWDPCCFWGPARWDSPRGLYDPRGPFDPRGRYDPRGRWDPRGVADPRGAMDPRGALDPRGLGANNLFSDRDGSVYRRSAGGWESRAGGDWSGVSAPHMEAQYGARSRGAGMSRGGGRRR